MSPIQSFRTGLALVAAAPLLGHPAAPLAAKSAAFTSGLGSESKATVYVPANPLAQFRPADDREEHRIDYTYLDEALEWFVIPMGISLRETPPRRDPRTGTRRIQGHESRFRLEGNRVAFAFFTDDVRASLTEYRQDLERVGSTLELTRLPRNEQLAFWLNLHNVAVIEALAYEYPLTQPVQRTFGSNDAPLDDAKLVKVAGVELSPRDIRERIVYANWSDPKVMYGFWRGEIGGPTIQRTAFNAENVDWLLSASATEFVNSLRGVQKYSGALQVSELYREVAPFYFADEEALRAHLAKYAQDEVNELLGKYEEIAYSPDYERDLADMSRGEAFTVFDPLGNINSTLFGPIQRSGESTPPATPVRFRVNWGTQAIWKERQSKINRAIRRGIPLGTVVVAGEDGVHSGEVQ
jgi:hypothetical protein